jgi:hypothetical protein
LEHGYIVISYDCSKPLAKQFSLIHNADAHFDLSFPDHHEDEFATTSAKPLMKMKVGEDGAMSAFTPENAPETEILLLEDFYSEECKSLVSRLSKFLDDWQRIVIVPRPNMETSIALTAWTRLERLDSIDEKKINNFISTYHNRGPEKTDE